VRLVAAGELQAEAPEELAQRGELLRLRALVNAVERLVAAALQEIRCRHVRCQHALLDQAMRVVALDRHDALDLAGIVEDQAGLDGLEVDGAALAACLQERPEDLVEAWRRSRSGSVTGSGFPWYSASATCV